MKRALRILLACDISMLALLIGFIAIKAISNYMQLAPNILPYVIYGSIIIVIGCLFTVIYLWKNQKKYE